MRHIPEEELHAYLDQALSRSQCVEIESHLAACPSCQSLRDGIAALRDRTTALLAKLAPARNFPPQFELLQSRAALAANQHRRRVHRAAWAASLIAAVGLGWTANYLTTPRAATPATPRHSIQVASAPVPSQTVSLAPTEARTPSSHHVARHAAPRPAAKPAADSAPVVPVAPVVAAPALELTSVNMPHTEPEELEGMWRTMSWDRAQAATGDKLPHVDGVPVVQVQVQSSEHGKQSLMVVAQQLASGEVIRTIEGPMSDVSHLLAQRTMTDPDPSAPHSASTADTAARAGTRADRTMAMQRGDRMLVITGALPSDSLLAMIRRMNAEMRSR